ncbi:MAG: LytR family transcriptional regulator [Actinomycetota bacterium]|nr:MAG: LytR family transcriptional regulator [Actinomycetota bacterium]
MPDPMPPSGARPGPSGAGSPGGTLPPYLNPRGGSRRRVGRIVAAAVSVGVLLTSTVGWAASQRYLGEINSADVFGGLIQADRPAESAEGVDAMNILIVGSDDRTGISNKKAEELHVGVEDYGRHSDTIMIMHIGADANHVTVVGIPRDSLVTIPACTDSKGKKTNPTRTKINSAYSLGGPACTVATVEKATGVRIDHYVEVNFQGFLAMVDAVGGVEVCLPKAVKDSDSGLNLKAGRQVVAGAQALAFVRVRYIDSDFGRIQRQQKFLTAMLQKVTSKGTLLNPLSLNGFIDAALKSLTVDETLGRDEILNLAGRLSSIDMKKVDFTTVPVADGNYTFNGQSTVLWDSAKSAALFAALRDDKPITKQNDTDVATVSVAPKDIGVAVLNGTTTAGFAKTAAEDFTAAGYAVSGQPKNATRTDYQTTTIQYDPRYDTSLKTLQAALPGAQTKAVKGLGKTFQVIVGSSYTGVSSVKVQAPTSSSTPTTPAPSLANPATSTAADDICG